MITVAFVLTSLYSFFLLLLAIGCLKLSKKKTSDYKGISVIVAARNEEENIERVIKCLQNQNYPKDYYEIIVVDDRSSDKTNEIVRQNNDVKLIALSTEQADTYPDEIFNSQGGKKRALTKGIEKSRFEILAFTDADCYPEANWLNEINCHFNEDTDFVAGYSPLYDNKNNLFTKLKNFERLSIFAVSAGSIGLNYGLTCTGRNVAYRKELFEKADGFKGIEDIPSGDDDLMLHRMNPYIRKMNFMLTPDSVVASYDKKDFNQQIHQETRRASKWKHYNIPIKTITATVFLLYLTLISLFITVLMGYTNPVTFIIMILMKVLSELVLIGVFLIRIKKTYYLLYLPLVEVIYLPYFIYFAVRGTFFNYRWKN